MSKKSYYEFRLEQLEVRIRNYKNSSLLERDGQIHKLRMIDKLTYNKIGEIVGLSHERVRQICWKYQDIYLNNGSKNRFWIEKNCKESECRQRST